MKNFLCLLSLLCILALTGQARAYSVTLTPNFQTIQMGSTGQVNVNLLFNPGEELFAVNFALAFDPTILRFDNLLFGAPIVADYESGFTPPSAGSDNLVTFNGAFSLTATLPATANIAPLASLYFTGIGSGSSLLDLTGQVLDFNGLGEVDVASIGSMDVASAPPVPEPATLLLLGSGLAGLLGFRKKIQKV